MVQHPAVTAQGRKVTTTILPKKMHLELSDEVAKPWKGRDGFAMGLLSWVIQSLDQHFVEINWPLLVPPVLSIIDDHEPLNKAEGCRMLTTLLEATPPSLLARTGLSEVFQDAIMPCLGYLPTLTPQNESIILLAHAYRALLALCRATWPLLSSSPSQSITTSEGQIDQRTRFLDNLIRKGILAAYAHCSEDPKITETLLDSLCLILPEQGIESVKHFKYTLPMISEILSNPFGSAYPLGLVAGNKALQSVIQNGWPRIADNRGEVLKGLTLCWLQLHDQTGSEFDQVRAELRKTISLLTVAVQESCDIQKEFKDIIAADWRLAGLLE